MDGLEELIKNGYMDPKHPVKFIGARREGVYCITQSNARQNGKSR